MHFLIFTSEALEKFTGLNMAELVEIINRDRSIEIDGDGLAAQLIIPAIYYFQK